MGNGIFLWAGPGSLQYAENCDQDHFDFIIFKLGGNGSLWERFLVTKYVSMFVSSDFANYKIFVRINYLHFTNFI